MKFFISKSKKLPRAAQKGLEPREEFMTKGKERFLAAFDASELARNARGEGVRVSGGAGDGPGRPAYVAAFFKVGVGVMAVLAVGVGLSAYADTANVAATNPLYPLKRLGENVQLALAPTADKPQLEATFAVRRADEIATLQASAPSSTLIPKLTDDMDQDINSSFAVAVNATGTVAVAVRPVASTSSPSAAGTGYGSGSQRAGRVHILGNSIAGITATTVVSSTISAAPVPSVAVSPAAISVYCNAFNVSTSGVLIGHLEGDLSLHPDVFAQFNKQCGSDSANGQDQGTRHSSVGDSASTSIISTTTSVTVHITPIGL